MSYKMNRNIKSSFNASIQFIEGFDEEAIPEIRLSKNQYNSSGQAIFIFNTPRFLSLDNFKDIKGMYLIDTEGTLLTTEINVRVSRKDGNYTTIEAIYKWQTIQEFERFMRFAKKYAEKNNLNYTNLKS